MSTWFTTSVTCPCGHVFEERFLRGANAMRSNALREAALAGTLNRPPCPKCGVRHALDAPVVYADPDRRQWVSVARPSDLERWSDIEKIAVAGFRTTLETAAADAFVDTRVRVVFDLDELREKLAIWDAGFDDGVIECVKLQCLGEHPEIRGRIRVTAIGSEIAMRADTGEWVVDRSVVDLVGNDPIWRERFPELFVPGFVSLDRYLR